MFYHKSSLSNLSSLVRRWGLMFQTSRIAAGRLEPSSESDPWKVSAFIYAVLELLLSILLLLGAAIAFITSQLVNYFGLEPPCAYIGCSHPDPSQIDRNRRYPGILSHACKSAVAGHCPDCHYSPTYYSRFQFDNVSLSDEPYDDNDTSHPSKDDACSLKAYEAADLEMDCQHVDQWGKDHPSSEESYLRCLYCNAPLYRRLNEHGLVKRRRKYYAISCGSNEDHNLPLLPTRSLLSDVTASQSEDRSDDASLTDDSINEECLGCIRTGTLCNAHKSKNVSEGETNTENNTHYMSDEDGWDAINEEVYQFQSLSSDAMEGSGSRAVPNTMQGLYNKNSELQEESACDTLLYGNKGPDLAHPEAPVQECQLSQGQKEIKQSKVLAGQDVGVSVQEPDEVDAGEVSQRYSEVLQFGEYIRERGTYEEGGAVDIRDLSTRQANENLCCPVESYDNTAMEGCLGSSVTEDDSKVALESCADSSQVHDAEQEVTLTSSSDSQLQQEGVESTHIQFWGESLQQEGDGWYCELSQDDQGFDVHVLGLPARSMFEESKQHDTVEFLGEMQQIDPDGEGLILHSVGNAHQAMPYSEEINEDLNSQGSGADGQEISVVQLENGPSVNSEDSCCEQDVDYHKEINIEPNMADQQTRFAEQETLAKEFCTQESMEMLTNKSVEVLTEGSFDAMTSHEHKDSLEQENEEFPVDGVGSLIVSQKLVDAFCERCIETSSVDEDLSNLKGNFVCTSETHTTIMKEDPEVVVQGQSFSSENVADACSDQGKEPCDLEQDMVNISQDPADLISWDHCATNNHKPDETVEELSASEKVAETLLSNGGLSGVETASISSNELSAGIHVSTREEMVQEPRLWVVAESGAASLDKNERISDPEEEVTCMSPGAHAIILQDDMYLARRGEKTEEEFSLFTPATDPDDNPGKKLHASKVSDGVTVLHDQHQLEIQQVEEGSLTEGDQEEGLEALKEALRAERNFLDALEAELEKERNAAAIAASEAMAMISRLQEEKSAMRMEVAQLQRMSEEKAEYDQQAMALLKEILVKREKEKHALEKELELYRERFLAQERDDTELSIVGNSALSSRLMLLDASSTVEQEHSEVNHNCGVRHIETADRKAIKRPRGTPLSKLGTLEETGGALGPSSSEAIPENVVTGQARCFLKGHQEVSAMDRSVFSTDDEETQFILERLWALEEELQELRQNESRISRGNVHGLGSSNRDDKEELEIDGTTGGSLPVHDVYEVVQTAPDQQSDCRWPSEECEIHEAHEDFPKEQVISPGNASQEMTVRMSTKRVARGRRLVFPEDLAATDQHSGCAVDAEDSWEQPALLSRSSEGRFLTTEELQQLTSRMRVLEGDRELLVQTVESCKQKDLAFDLLQEIAQHLRELRTAGVKVVAAGGLSENPSSQKSSPAKKKRRYCNTSTQLQDVAFDEESILH